MLQGNAADMRDALVSDFKFTWRPEPLDRWMRESRVSPAAAAVFWAHWRAAHMSRQAADRARRWKSAIPLRTLSTELGVNISTVKAAHKTLQQLGLIQRTSQGRDPRKPYHQPTSITEILLPASLVQGLRARTPLVEPKEAVAAPSGRSRATAPDGNAGTQGAPSPCDFRQSVDGQGARGEPRISKPFRDETRCRDIGITPKDGQLIDKVLRRITASGIREGGTSRGLNAPVRCAIAVFAGPRSLPSEVQNGKAPPLAGSPGFLTQEGSPPPGAQGTSPSRGKSSLPRSFSEPSPLPSGYSSTFPGGLLGNHPQSLSDCASGCGPGLSGVEPPTVEARGLSSQEAREPSPPGDAAPRQESLEPWPGKAPAHAVKVLPPSRESSEPCRERLGSPDPTKGESLNDGPSSDSLTRAGVDACRISSPRLRSRSLRLRMSEAERARYDAAVLSGRPGPLWDSDTSLSVGEQLWLAGTLKRTQLAPVSRPLPNTRVATQQPAGVLIRRLPSPLIFEARRRLSALVGEDRVATLWEELRYSVEEGALSALPFTHAMNVALKLVRSGRWSRPRQMIPGATVRAWESATPRVAARTPSRIRRNEH